MTVLLILTVSYCLVMLGSTGMILFTTRFPFATGLSDLRLAKQRLLGLNGQQVWQGSWSAIILGTAGQLAAAWLQWLTRAAG